MCLDFIAQHSRTARSENKVQAELIFQPNSTTYVNSDTSKCEKLATLAALEDHKTVVETSSRLLSGTWTSEGRVLNKHSDSPNRHVEKTHVHTRSPVLCRKTEPEPKPKKSSSWEWTFTWLNQFSSFDKEISLVSACQVQIKSSPLFDEPMNAINSEFSLTEIIHLTIILYFNIIQTTLK
ncbi:hypothetical protein NQ317_015258 [Molorchus minor]|uniref:Uncharacterized protein n=1 Tax=Molorchus minor TaxID=1323400 RepID=A0ABQ9IWZ3_9CUCU|nr:hypothetical protein NQ317_015258 [Molorchus minor]